MALVQMDKESQFLLGIETRVAEKHRLPKTLNVLGKVRPRTQSHAEVMAPIEGRLVLAGSAQAANLGSRVSAGQVLGFIEGTELDGSHGVVTDSARRFPLLAPISGLITAIHFHVGEHIEKDLTLFEIMDLSRVWIEGQVYESDLATVEKAKRAFVKSLAYPDLMFEGKLASLGQEVDEKTRTIKALFEVDNPEWKLRANMFAEIAIDIGTTEEVVTIPKAALLEVQGRKIVYVKTNPEHFLARDVVLGIAHKGLVEVKSGIRDQDRVVVVGSYVLWSKGLTGK
ncbi:MAG: efflux RND transporter periplasmic adaptor subunit [Planctomycetes bacterium]|nr:efflux RND transporter periplasmic adaptor subunit [Planctomycetota bacterium]